MQLAYPVLRAYLGRGARLWLAVRLLASGILLVAGLNPLRLAPAAVVEIVVFSVIACLVDTYWHHERAWLGNLGIRPLTLGSLFVFPALLGETILAILRTWTT